MQWVTSDFLQRATFATSTQWILQRVTSVFCNEQLLQRVTSEFYTSNDQRVKSCASDFQSWNWHFAWPYKWYFRIYRKTILSANKFALPANKFAIQVRWCKRQKYGIKTKKIWQDLFPNECKAIIYLVGVKEKIET